MTNEHHYAIIMAGGAGTRFWPASRFRRPKQLLALGTNHAQSMLQATVRRVRDLVALDNVFVVTAAHLAPAIEQQQLGIPPENVLLEPVGRNTAPCIAWANDVIQARDPQAVVAVFSADHVIADESAFVASVQRAIAHAASGVVTLLGIHPTRPETGYGYIELGEHNAAGVYDVKRFVEKPDAATARVMIESKRFVWNGGYFFFPAALMTQAVERYLPRLAQGIARIREARVLQGTEPHNVIEEVFPTLPSVSVDVGIMERMDRLAAVVVDCGWSDVGSWQVLWELADKDAYGNAAPAGTVVIDSRNNMVADWDEHGEQAGAGRVIALVGVQDMVVVQTHDALLVMPRERCQQVRDVVEILRREGKGDKL